jgi:hypothetical protein
MEWRNRFILAANERATYSNAETSTLKSPSYNHVSDSTDACPVKESQNLTDDLEEPEPSQDELVTSFYPAANSFSYPAAASTYRAKESGYGDLSDIREESETSADELVLDTLVKPTLSKKRPSKGLEKTVSKALRQSTSSPCQKHRSKR